MSKLDVKTKSAGVKFDDIKAQMMEDAEFHEWNTTSYSQDTSWFHKSSKQEKDEDDSRRAG